LTDTATDCAGVGRVHVAVGVIVDADGQRVLLAKRPAHVHQGDLWEFPGGKVEPGETSSQALARELREELAIEVVCCSPLLEVAHDYADKSVLLEVWQISRFTGQAQGSEGQLLRWAAIENLHQFTFPAANRRIVAQLQANWRKPMA
jgi:8-oxo-dGTP diphosphatase